MFHDSVCHRPEPLITVCALCICVSARLPACLCATQQGRPVTSRPRTPLVPSVTAPLQHTQTCAPLAASANFDARRASADCRIVVRGRGGGGLGDLLCPRPGTGAVVDTTFKAEDADKENKQNARYLEIAASISEVRYYGRVCQASPKGGSSAKAAKLIRRTRQLEMPSVSELNINVENSESPYVETAPNQQICPDPCVCG